MSSEKPLWQINTEKLASDIIEQTRSCHNEEEVKMKVEPLLKRIFVQAGIDVNIVE